ncbi:MAG: UDP-2,3-diacylglucosamine diphosphatase [Alistipes senegalensis]|nr:UDP-2,3-diacylglucosamine diphosphatase [Oxalobacter formigenes]MCM1280811.1 UDP-2,3-diacylglucosamine diphosphatase [Alistipes senegalensis]
MQTGKTASSPKSQALFISDLHLAESLPDTTGAFLDFLSREARQSERLFILGDLFEYWAGDDDIGHPFNQRILRAIRELSLAGTAVFWQPGNRDFLTGERFLRETGATGLPDLHVAEMGGLKVAVAHGDAQCLGDTDYLAFRAMVRNPQWQQQFLSMPLAQRKLMIEKFRKDSVKENAGKSESTWDVTPSAIDEVFSQTGAAVFVHGHIHRPGKHLHGSQVRYVLPDWELDQAEKRGGWLELAADGQFRAYPVSR